MIFRKNAEGVGDRRECQRSWNRFCESSHYFRPLSAKGEKGIWRCDKGFVSLQRHSAFAHRDEQTTDEGNDDIKALESERGRANIITRVRDKKQEKSV